MKHAPDAFFTKRGLIDRGKRAAVLTTILGGMFVTAAEANCFSKSRLVLPTEEEIVPTLTNGDRGLDMIRAVASGQIGSVEALAREQPELLFTRTVLPTGTRPYAGNMADLLTIAVTNCDARMLGALLELGVDPNGAIPGLGLTYAILADDQVMAVMLLQGGADPDATTEGRTTALREVLYHERPDAVDMLTKFGADVNRFDLVGGTALNSALSFGDWASAKVLMDAGANPWQVANKGVLPAFKLQNASGLGRQSNKIREELLTRAEVGAPIWPPPAPQEVVQNIRSGTWPTAEMIQAGFVVTEGALRSIRAMPP